MEQVIAAFLTGLTAGGLSCLAVQGGLLASSLAQQLEHEIAALPAGGKKKGKQAPFRPQVARPIVLFLAAKIVAYTLLGFLLGLVGQTMQLNFIARAVLQIAIGVFMVGAALRLFNVHPIFRYFAFEPPAAVRRFIRQRSKNGDAWFAPLFLGGLTVLIPCGITQTMMVLAVGTGNPWMGAAILFAFTLGASPLFFVLAYFSTQLGARLEKYFMRLVAVALLILGFISVETGLNLMGSPFSVTAFTRGMFGTQAQVATPAENVSLPLDSSSVVAVQVKNEGYFPPITHTRAGIPITLELTTEGTYSCARSFVIPSLRVEKLLPASGKVTISIPAQAPGAVLDYSCSMGMYTGQIVFDQ